MASGIERMNKMRRMLVAALFVSSFVGLAGFIAPIFAPLTGARPDSGVLFWFGAALAAWFAALIVLAIAYRVYRGKLSRDPGLDAAVNDERVAVSWLRAYRFAFFAVVVASLAWAALDVLTGRYQMQARIILPNDVWIVLMVAALSVSGAFLRYSAEGRDE